MDGLSTLISEIHGTLYIWQINIISTLPTYIPLLRMYFP
jgi:hypothetical protein